MNPITQTQGNNGYVNSQGVYQNSFPQITNTLNATNLGQVTPISITPPATQTKAIGLQGSLESGAVKTANDTALLEAEAKKVEADRLAQTTAKNGLFDFLKGKTGNAEMVNQANIDANVDPAKKELNDINAQILQEQVSNRRRIEEIQKNTEGKTTTSLNNEVAAINRESVSKQADLAVIQYAKQNNYAQAKEIADRQVSMKLEQQQNEYEALKFNYEDNKEQFTKSEQRQYESMLADKKRKLDTEENELKTLSNTKLELLKSASEQDAPISVLKAIQNSGSPEQAILSAGKYGGDILAKELKRVQISEALVKANEAKNGGKLTATQQSALSYANRVNDANKIIDSIGGNFTGIGSYVGGGTVFGVGVPNALKSSERQQFEQAQRNFINAVLRRESGAAISDSEFDNAKMQYFPQPGDSVEVVQQKKDNRSRTLENLLREGGQDVDTPTPSKTVKIGGQNVTAGTVIQNSSGQKGRVNEDGTITLIN